MKNVMVLLAIAASLLLASGNQAEAALVVEPNGVTVRCHQGPCTGSEPVEVTSNPPEPSVNWVAAILQPEWISADPSEGTTPTTVTITLWRDPDIPGHFQTGSVTFQEVGNPGNNATVFTFYYWHYANGDANLSGGQINMGDLVYLADYLFFGGPAPGNNCIEPDPPFVNCDLDCSGGVVNVADLLFMIDYLFFAGPAPCDNCN